MIKTLHHEDMQATIERYTSRFKTYGYSPKSLGWDKGKQDIRFEVLTSQYDFSGKTVLDVGCGFGDLNQILRHKYENNYSYLGIDIVPALISEAKNRYIGQNIEFIAGEFLSLDIGRAVDYVVASGIFNYRLDRGDNYEFIAASMEKALAVSRDGIAFDFLSDKVDYRHQHTFHSAPETILSMAYKFSRNIILRSDYMPFEFSLFIFKDDTFATEDTLFNHYKRTVMTPEKTPVFRGKHE